MYKKEDFSYAARAVAKNIVVLRDILGLTQEQFAERVQLPVERIKQMEGVTGALDDCVDLLRIAQSCNVQYVDLFESDRDSSGHTKCNARVPKYVMNVIDAKRIKENLTKRELCDKIGAHFTVWSKWMHGDYSPSPLSFNNIIAVLGLKYYDFTAAKPENAEEDLSIPEEEPDFAPVEANALQPVETSAIEEETMSRDEIKMLKVLRLQNRIDQYVADIDAIVKNIMVLRNELAKYK